MKCNFLKKRKTNTYSNVNNSKLEVRIRRSDDRRHHKANQGARHRADNNIYWNIPPTKYKKGEKMSNRKNAITAELLPTEKAKTAKKGLYGLEDKDRTILTR